MGTVDFGYGFIYGEIKILCKKVYYIYRVAGKCHLQIETAEKSNQHNFT